MKKKTRAMSLKICENLMQKEKLLKIQEKYVYKKYKIKKYNIKM